MVALRAYIAPGLLYTCRDDFGLVLADTKPTP